jgi:CDP-diacylglycerol--serine O-phosphatidyltransferase
VDVLIKKSIPNFITLSNLFLGFTSLVLLSLSLSESTDYTTTACYLILISCVLDSLDGKVARKLNISSEFGKEIDSLADLISFCLVPSFLIFIHYKSIFPDAINLPTLIFLSSFPLILGSIRLAKYNALKEMRDSEKYLGLPTPANAIFICSLILFTYNIPYREFFKSDIQIFNSLNEMLAIIFNNKFLILYFSLISSILLLSKVNYEKFPLISFKINKKNNIDLVKIIIFLIILFFSIIFKSSDIVLLLFVSFYIFGNLVKYLFNLIKG